MSNETLGKYQLIGHLATGGMADIFLARVEGLHGFEKLFVVKRILPHLARNEEYLQMFLDEARIAASLQHTNIVQIYEIGSVDEQYFMAMEYLHGHDLSKLMRRVHEVDENVPLEQAIHIVTSLCSALHYAHEKKDLSGASLNIVHRDISPQNVFVTYEGHAKLVDFGIAKASNRATETRSGVLKGKLGYMSPQQACGEEIDRRADIFALAVILWELTTGRRLFTGDNEYEVLKKVLEEEPPPPSTYFDNYPPPLERIVMKGLARNVEDRYQTAADMQDDLERFARGCQMTFSDRALADLMKRLFPEDSDISKLVEEHSLRGRPTVQEMPPPTTVDNIEKRPTKRVGTAITKLTPPPGSTVAAAAVAVDVEPPIKRHHTGAIALALLLAAGVAGVAVWQLLLKPAKTRDIRASQTTTDLGSASAATGAQVNEAAGTNAPTAPASAPEHSAKAEKKTAKARPQTATSTHRRHHNRRPSRANRRGRNPHRRTSKTAPKREKGNWDRDSPLLP